MMEQLISGNHFQMHWGQESDWEKSTWIYEVEITLGQLASPYWDLWKNSTKNTNALQLDSYVCCCCLLT